MPTETARSSVPSAKRAGKPEMNLRDGAPLSTTALAIIAVLVMILHVAGGERLGRLQAHASVAVQAGETQCPADATQPTSSLPFD